jgi:hypothetical protein
MSYVSAHGIGALSPSQSAARQELSKKVVALCAKASERIDYLLDNEASLLSVITRFPAFIQNAYKARESLKKAKEELYQKFLPIALAAIEDPNRNLAEVKSSIEGYLYSLEQQLKVVIEISENQTFTGAVAQAFEDAKEEVREGMDPTKSLIPWVIGAGAVVTLAILLRR